ncbi:MAG: hypothetical protein J0L87_14290 [Bacteroidetes bacterium]|nr:hypothetical protein [Bacteroidota bacterium]
MGNRLLPSDALNFFKEILATMDQELNNSKLPPKAIYVKKKRLESFQKIYDTLELPAYADLMYRISNEIASLIEKDPSIEIVNISIELLPNPNTSKQAHIPITLN